MASIWTVHLHAASSLPIRILSNELQFRKELGLGSCHFTNWSRSVKCRKFVVRALSSDDDRRLRNEAIVIPNSERENNVKSPTNPLAKLQESVGSLPLFVVSEIQATFTFTQVGQPIVPAWLVTSGNFAGTNFAIGLCIVVATMLVIFVRGYAERKSRDSHPGSVADLVRRGQLRSDRRGISTPLKYEEPFNNPMIKVSKSNSTVEMCGKVYRLAPVTLTDDEQRIHQKRRSRAYQWKRPTIFLKEGEAVPPDVDPDTVRWIPANHPFATTSSDIDEDLAQNNVYQKHGVPFRIQAEHEALQRKLEDLQNDQKLSKLVIDPAAARDFERPMKPYLKPKNVVEHSACNPKLDSAPFTSDRVHNSSANKPMPEYQQNP